MRLFGVSLGERNKKVGEVLNFSLPSIETCPGASSWCLKHCYGRRYEKLRPACLRAYERNLNLAKDTKRFAWTMIGILPRIVPCFRIHVSGDFYSSEYVDAWRQICREFPNVKFWSYTRSWAVKSMTQHLIELRDLPNVELFASTDPTMPLPPKGWRVAFINNDPRANGVKCKHQANLKSSCLECGYCFNRKHGNVIFKCR